MMTPQFLLLGLAIVLVSLSVSWAEGEYEVIHHAEGCIEYKKTITTKPNNRPKRIDRMNVDLEIGLVKNVERTSVYWCDLQIEDDVDGIRTWTHYHHNATHWTVEKGCSGTFRVVECKAEVLEEHKGIPTFVNTDAHAIVADEPAVQNGPSEQGLEHPDRGTMPTKEQNDEEDDEWMQMFGSPL